MLLATTGDMMAGGIRELPWGLRTGGLMFEKVYGMHQFQFLAANPKVETKYSRAMTELDASCAPHRSPCNSPLNSALTLLRPPALVLVKTLQKPGPFSFKYDDLHA